MPSRNLSNSTTEQLIVDALPSSLTPQVKKELAKKLAHIAVKNLPKHPEVPITPIEALLTYSELGSILKVSRGSLRIRVSQGTLPYLKMGRSVRFRLSSVMQWIETHQGEASNVYPREKAAKMRAASKKSA